MYSPTKHQVFVSFHHKDQEWKEAFEKMYAEKFISVSVDVGDIDPDNEDEHIARLVRENHIVHSSVVFSLYGVETHGRKHVDWEIRAALSKAVGGHKGLVVMILPTFPVKPYNHLGNYDETVLYPYLHPRTVDNLKSGYADLVYWPGLYSGMPGIVPLPIDNVIETAFNKRDSYSHLIDLSEPKYQRNR